MTTLVNIPPSIPLVHLLCKRSHNPQTPKSENTVYVALLLTIDDEVGDEYEDEYKEYKDKDEGEGQQRRRQQRQQQQG